jgi:hypothetical protein
MFAGPDVTAPVNENVAPCDGQVNWLPPAWIVVPACVQRAVRA